MQSLCLKCKGRLMCGRKQCQILERHSHKRKLTQKLKDKSFQGNSPPSVFVSWHGYPKVKLAPLSPPEVLKDADLLDNPERWYGLPSEDIINFRESLIRSDTSVEVTQARDPSRQLGEMQEMVMAVKPVEVEVDLKKAPDLRLSFQETSAPLGPSAPLDSFQLTENPRIPKKIDYLVGDVDVKAVAAMGELYQAGFSVHTLYKLLSAGLLGVKKKRTLVPTRWSITAADDTISKQLVEKVKGYQNLGEYHLYHSEYLWNDFYVLLIPGGWMFEQLEAWQPGGLWTEKMTTPSIVQDHEFHNGRKKYASDVAGAYYSARLAVCEHLIKLQRQAGAIVFREIGEEYRTPLGVWQIRENVRHALKQKPLTFSDLDLALKYIGTKLKIPIKYYRQKSQLLDNIKNQKRIFDWL